VKSFKIIDQTKLSAVSGENNGEKLEIGNTQIELPRSSGLSYQ